MSVVLAATWNPRGEVKRFRKLYPDLSRIFAHMTVVLPPGTHPGLLLSMNHFDGLTLYVTDNWAGGRHESLVHALDGVSDTSASHIMYADMDRLLRWAETRYEELRQTIKRVQMYDCLVIGRTEHAYNTHPQAIIQTEALSNRVFSHLLNQPLDLSAGAKGFSLEAAKVVAANAGADHPFGADSEWVILARRGGFEVRSLLVDGLDWESADRHADESADEIKQAHTATVYDADPTNWKKRVAVAEEIINTGIEALKRELTTDCE